VAVISYEFNGLPPDDLSKVPFRASLDKLKMQIGLGTQISFIAVGRPRTTLQADHPLIIAGLIVV